MKERPLIMQAAGVLATLAKLKNQTRRVCKDQSVFDAARPVFCDDDGDVWQPHPGGAPGDTVLTASGKPLRCPYGVPGDELWLREAWQHNPYGGIVYRAGSGIVDCDGRGWKPSIFMPRWASRIQLEITNIRCERLQAISEEDAIAEGWPRQNELYPSTNTDYKAILWFRRLWDSINAKPKPVLTKGKITSYVSYPWDEIRETREHRGLPWEVVGNPMVWPIDYKLKEAKDADS